MQEKYQKKRYHSTSVYSCMIPVELITWTWFLVSQTENHEEQQRNDQGSCLYKSQRKYIECSRF